MAQWRVLIAITLVLAVLSSRSKADGQCDEVCNTYKSFALKAGPPETLAPLLKLYQSCMECVKGAGHMDCSKIAPQGVTQEGIKCEYLPSN